TANIGDVDVLTLPALVAGSANIGDVDVLTLPAIPAGNNNIGDVDVASAPTLTKGTQGSTGFSVQNLTDAGRVARVYSATFTAATTEALVTLTPIADGTTSATCTSCTVTNAKRFRDQ